MSKFTLSKGSLAVGLVTAAATLPAAAHARPQFDSPGTIVASAPAPAVSAPQAPRPTAAGQSGFQWGDAVIGAAGAMVLVGAGAVATGPARRRRGPRQVAG
jgi:hypothetical protein